MGWPVAAEAALMKSTRTRGTLFERNGASMKKFVVSCALLLTASASPFAEALTPEAKIVYAQFLDELKQRSTKNAVECGLVEDKAARDAALTCADQAVAGRQPFWFAQRMRGVDSALWMGVASDGRGHLYRIFFDSDVKGGGDPPSEPRMYAYRCSDKNVRAEDWPPFLEKGCKGIEVAAPRVPAAP